MPRLIFKGDTNETFGKFLPTPIIDSIVVELVDPDDPFLASMTEIGETVFPDVTLPDSTELTKYTISTSIFFNSSDDFDVGALTEELFNVTPSSDPDFPNDESLYVNVIVLKNANQISKLKQDKMYLKQLCQSATFADGTQDAFAEAGGDPALSNSDFDIFYSIITGQVQVISIPLSDFEDTISFTPDYDEDGNPIVKSSHVKLTGYIRDFTSLETASMFCAITTRSISDILGYSDATFALNFSDVSYEDVVVDGNLATFSEPVFIDVNNQFYPNTPLQALNTKYYKIEDFGRKDIIRALNSLTDEYRERARIDSLLREAIDGIDYVIAMYGGSHEFLPRLNRYKELFPSKSAALATGRLYDRFRTVILNSNTTAIAQQEVVKRIFRNYKIIDARAVNFEDIASISFDESLDSNGTDFAYPVTIESNVAKYVPVSSPPLDYPGSSEIAYESIYGPREVFIAEVDSFVADVRELAEDYFLRGEAGSLFGGSAEILAIITNFADFALAYAEKFVDSDFGWRVYLRAADEEDALDKVKIETFRGVLNGFTDDAGGIGPGTGYSDDVRGKDIEGEFIPRDDFNDQFYDLGKGLRAVGQKQLDSLFELFADRKEQLSLIVPKRDASGGAVGLADTEFSDDDSIDSHDISKSVIAADGETEAFDEITSLINTIQENVGAIDVFQHARTAHGTGSGTTNLVFLIRKTRLQLLSEIQEIVYSAIGITEDIDDDISTTTLDNLIKDTLMDAVETFVTNHKNEMMEIYDNPTTSPLTGLGPSARALWITTNANNYMAALEDAVTSQLSSLPALQFYFAQKFKISYTGPETGLSGDVLCQPAFANYVSPLGAIFGSKGVVYGSWSSLQGHVADGGLSVEERYTQANIADAVFNRFDEMRAILRERLVAHYTDLLDDLVDQYDAGGVSVLKDIDIVIKKSGYFFYDMEKFIRKGSFISKYVNVDRMLRTVNLAHEMLNNGVQMKKTQYTHDNTTTLILESPASTDYESAGIPTNYESLTFLTSTEGVYKMVTPLQGGFRYNDFFDIRFRDETTVGATEVEKVASAFGVGAEYSHLVMRNYNFTNFKDSALFGSQTWRDNYRLMMFYYQFFLDDDVLNVTEEGLTSSKSALEHEIHDSTFHVLRAIINKYISVYDDFIEFYVEPAMQQCSYDEFNLQFNNFFVEGILSDFPSAENQPWYKMVALHVIYVNMFTDIYNGDYNTMLDSANSILDQIKPQTGNLESLLNFKVQAEKFNDFLEDTQARANAEAAATLSADGIDIVTHAATVDTITTIVDYIGDFTDALADPIELIDAAPFETS